MFQTVAPPEAGKNYSDVVIGVYRMLAEPKGTITGFKVAPDQFSTESRFWDAIGVKPLIKFFNSINLAFPHYTLNIENLVIRGEKVMAKYSLVGVPTTKLMGLAPNGSSAKVTGLDIFRLDRGVVVEYWNASHQIEPETKL